MPVESSEGWADGGDAGDEDWLDDVIWPAEDDQGIPWAGAVGPPGAGWPGDHGQQSHGRTGRLPGTGGRSGKRGGPLASLVAVAVLAAGAGAGLAIAVTGPSGTPAAATSPSPGRASGVLPGGPAGGVPGGTSGVPGGGQPAQIFVIGTVTAVSATSITIGGNGPPVTAAVTGSTRVTGRVSSIAGIKVGDRVSAQVSQSGGRMTATAIQYPAQQGGGVP